jgi:hypothetical protein
MTVNQAAEKPGTHQAFEEAVPVLGESGEQRVDIGVFGNIAAIDQGAVELGGKFGDARFEQGRVRS